MEIKKFSAYDALAYGFRSVFENFKLFFLLALTLCGIGALLAMITALVNYDFFIGMRDVGQKLNGCTGDVCNRLWDFFTTPLYREHAALLTVTGCLVAIIGIALFFGYKKMMLEFQATGNSNISELFSCFNLIPQAMAATFLYMLIVVGGMLFFVIPGIYWSLRFRFFPYIIIEHNVGPIQALKKSYAITEGQTWQIFSLALSVWLLHFISSFIIVGAIVIFPATELAYVYVYRRLQS